MLVATDLGPFMSFCFSCHDVCMRECDWCIPVTVETHANRCKDRPDPARVTVLTRALSSSCTKAHRVGNEIGTPWDTRYFTMVPNIVCRIPSPIYIRIRVHICTCTCVNASAQSTQSTQSTHTRAYLNTDTYRHIQIQSSSASIPNIITNGFPAPPTF